MIGYQKGERFLFKINADKFGFAREPQPDRVSRDYAAELVRKLIADEKAAREANDNILDGYISQEADIRGTEDARLQALIGEINTVLNSHGGSIAGLLEQAQAEAQARESKDDALQALINALQAASDKEIKDRTSKDAELDTRITAEVQEREAKDAELRKAIDAEAQAREEKDSELQANIDKEAKMRGENDSSIRAKLEPLSGIINGAGISHFEYSDGLGIVSDVDFIVTPDYNEYIGISSGTIYTSAEDFSFIQPGVSGVNLQEVLDKKENGNALRTISGSSTYIYSIDYNAFTELRIVDALIQSLMINFSSTTTFDGRYRSILIFRTGESPTLKSSVGLIKWFGDDCTGNMLTLQPSKTYRIEFYYNGFDMIANVSSYNTSE